MRDVAEEGEGDAANIGRSSDVACVRVMLIARVRFESHTRWLPLEQIPVNTSNTAINRRFEFFFITRVMTEIKIMFYAIGRCYD